MELGDFTLLLGAIIVVFMFTVYLDYVYNKKFRELDVLLSRIDLRFRDLNRRLDELKRYSDNKVDDTKKYVEKYVDSKLSELIEYVDLRINESNRVLSAQQEFLLEYLALRGVLSENEVLMFKNETTRLSTTSLHSKLLRKREKKSEVLAE